MTSDVFRGKQFALDAPANIDIKSKTKLREKITQHNGIISYIITKKSDYVISMHPPTDQLESYKTLTARKYNIPVVTAEFIDSCLEKGELIDWQIYSWKTENKGNKCLLKKGRITIDNFHIKVEKECSKIWKYKDQKGPNFHENKYFVAKSYIFEGKVKNQGTEMCLIELHVKEYLDGDGYRFCVYIERGFWDSRKINNESRECLYYNSVDFALNCYVRMWKKMMSSVNSMKVVKQFSALNCIKNSEELHLNQLLLDDFVPNDRNIKRFINIIYNELEHELESKCKWQDISSENLETAAGILLDMIKNQTNDTEKLTNYCKLMNRFVNFTLVDEVGLIQRVQDRLNLSEVSPYKVNLYELIYKALRCNIECLSVEEDDYKLVQNLVSEHENSTIKNIFRVNKLENEEIANVGNEVLLFHDTPSSDILGSLSRGLVLDPKKLYCNTNLEFNFGNGLYFKNKLKPSSINTNKFQVIHKVALGKCYNADKKMPDLIAPPEGFDSVHFQEEFVIYNTNQQKINFVLEFQLLGEESKANNMPLDLSNKETSDDNNDEVTEVFTMDDILHPSKKEIKSGLHCINNSNTIDLTRISIHGRLFDLTAEVVILQEYKNDTSDLLQAKYFLPVLDMEAICGFEAFVNGHHIIGVVDDNAKGIEAYKTAINQGKSALLMTQETQDGFSINIGNIQPKSSVLTKITYVTELEMEGDLISFRLPGTICNNKSLAIDSLDIETHLEFSLNMPYDIKSISSPTHQIRIKQTATMATVQTAKNEKLDHRGFQLLIALSEIHCPRMWTEEDEVKHTQACMLLFYPEFETNELQNKNSKVILVLDCSNSLKSCFINAQKLALLCLQKLPPECKFNIAAFGSTYEELYPDCVPLDSQFTHEAKNFILNQKPTKGSSIISPFLKSLFLLSSTSGSQNIIIISDGHFQDKVETLLQVISETCTSAGSTRIFTLAVGGAPNRHLMKNIAKVGAGEFEVFDQSILKATWVDKVDRFMTKVQMPVLTDISVEWQIFDDSNKSLLLQAPQTVTSLFNGSRLIVYGLLQNMSSVMATLKAKIPGGKEIRTVVSPYNSSASRGKMLHRLATRALVRDWETGVLSVNRSEHEFLKLQMKSRLVELSKSYSIVTPFTCFLAVDDSATVEDLYLTFEELVRRELVDKLSYVEYNDVVNTSVKPNTRLQQQEQLVTSNVELTVTREEYQRQLVSLLHAHKCSRKQKINPMLRCSLPHCSTMRNVLEHVTICNAGEGCSVLFCASSKKIISHFKNCIRVDCRICLPLKQSKEKTDTKLQTPYTVGSSIKVPVELSYKSHERPYSHKLQNRKLPPFLTNIWDIQESEPLQQTSSNDLNPRNSNIIPSTRNSSRVETASFHGALRALNLPADIAAHNSIPTQSLRVGFHPNPQFPVDAMTSSNEAIASRNTRDDQIIEEINKLLALPGSNFAQSYGTNYTSTETQLHQYPMSSPILQQPPTTYSRRRCSVKFGRSAKRSSLPIMTDEHEKQFLFEQFASLPQTTGHFPPSCSGEDTVELPTSGKDLTIHKQKRPIQETDSTNALKKQKLEHVWIGTNFGCINYGSGLPLFSMLCKKLQFRPFKKEQLKKHISSANENLHVSRLVAKINQIATEGKRFELNTTLWNDIKNTLNERGLKSLPLSSRTAIYIIISSMGLVFEFIHLLCANLLPLRLDDLGKIQAYVESITAAQKTCVKFSEEIEKELAEEIQTVVEMNSVYPMLYLSLEIGHCWEEGFEKLTKGKTLFVETIVELD